MCVYECLEDYTLPTDLLEKSIYGTSSCCLISMPLQRATIITGNLLHCSSRASVHDSVSPVCLYLVQMMVQGRKEGLCSCADALKQELVEGKRREEQMQTRIVALEGEVQKSRASYNELESSVTALATHLQVHHCL